MSKASWLVQDALQSWQRLNEVLGQLSHDDAIQALELEAASRRRPTILKRLVQRAAELNRLTYTQTLSERYLK